jgi:hypothetical protein
MIQSLSQRQHFSESLWHCNKMYISHRIFPMWSLSLLSLLALPYEALFLKQTYIVHDGLP